MGDVTALLNGLRSEHPGSSDELLPLVYDELRRLAASRMAKLPPGQTLQATALVHEAYLRLRRSGPECWDHRGHFFASAAEAMRRILIDQARRKCRLKRGAGAEKMNIDDVQVAMETEPEKLLVVDEALRKLAVEDPTKAELVKMRFFAGLTLAEAAEALGVSVPTAKRYWAFARAWLHDEIAGDA